MTQRKRPLLRGYINDQKRHVNVPDSEFLLDTTYHQYMAQFSMDAMALFEYEGLPETVTVERIEYPLFTNGFCVFTLHKETKKPIVMPCSLIGNNIYGEPTHYKITSLGSGNARYEDFGEIGKDGIVIKNNLYKIPTHTFLEMYCKRLSDTELTMDMNLFALKTPFILEVNDKNQTSVKLAMEKYKQFESAIFVQSKKDKSNKGLSEPNTEFLKVHQTGAVSHLSELMNYSHDLQNDLYTRLGINNAMQDKKERMVVDEVNAQKEQIQLAQTISYDYRKVAIDDINKLFGLSIVIKRKGEDNEPDVSVNDSDVHDKP